MILILIRMKTNRRILEWREPKVLPVKLIMIFKVCSLLIHHHHQNHHHHHHQNHHLWVKLVEISKTEICLLPLGVCQPAVWNHHYLATSGSGDDNYDDDYDYNDVEHDLPAATPNGASSKTRQSSGFSPSSPAATWSILTSV